MTLLIALELTTVLATSRFLPVTCTALVSLFIQLAIEFIRQHCTCLIVATNHARVRQHTQQVQHSVYTPHVVHQGRHINICVKFGFIQHRQYVMYRCDVTPEHNSMVAQDQQIAQPSREKNVESFLRSVSQGILYMYIIVI